MKKSMLFVLMAILAMSAAVFGADKKNNQTQFAVSVKAEPQAIIRGEHTTITIAVEGGKQPITLTCDGRGVTSPFKLSPDSTRTFLITAKDSDGNITAVTAQVVVFDLITAEFYIGEFKVKSTDPRTVPDMERKLQPVRDFLRTNMARGIEVRPRWVGYADTVKASRKLNLRLAGGRIRAIAGLLGVKPVTAEMDSSIETKYRGVRVIFSETSESVAKRLGNYKAASVTAPQPIPAPVPPPPIVMPGEKADRVRVTLGVGYAQESPMASLGLRIPLAQDSTRVKSDVHVAGYFGHDGHDFSWATSAQADFRLGRGFYIGPILMGGQNFPDFGEVTNYSEAAGGGVLQARVKNRLVLQLGLVGEYRAYYRVDGQKTRPDEIGPKLFSTIYYAF